MLQIMNLITMETPIVSAIIRSFLTAKAQHREKRKRDVEKASEREREKFVLSIVPDNRCCVSLQNIGESSIIPVEIDIFARARYPTTLLELRIQITIIFTTATNGENGVVGDLRIILRLY